MKHRFSPLFSIVISLITLLTTGFVTANTVKQVITVEKKVAVIFMKVSPDCSSEAACEPGFPAGLRANIHEPRLLCRHLRCSNKPNDDPLHYTGNLQPHAHDVHSY